MIPSLRGAKRRGNPDAEPATRANPDCFAAAQQQFILSAAAGGAEGLPMTEKPA
jgi:hypothetical protein